MSLQPDERTLKLELVKRHIKSYPDFPQPGIVFRDIFAVLHQPRVFAALHDLLVDYALSIEPEVHCVVGLEARGFLFGPLVALALKVPFVPIRKSGKLPGTVKSVAYQLEYGEDRFEVQEESIAPNTNVMLIDDLLATGGSLTAVCQLITACNANVVDCLAIIELVDLNGKQNIPCSNVHSLIQF